MVREVGVGGGEEARGVVALTSVCGCALMWENVTC